MAIPEQLFKAGRVAARVREDVRRRNFVGATLLEVCEYVEREIEASNCRPAFPCNVCLNSVAAHYTGEIGEKTAVGSKDVVKVDIGVHVDGFVADTAVTVAYAPEHQELVLAAEMALSEAVKKVRAGVSAGEIGAVIAETASRLGFKPVVNLSGHSIEPYTIHAGKSIPNLYVPGTPRLKPGEVYAIEPFVTQRTGAGSVVDSERKNIFSIVTMKRTRERDLDEFLTAIWERCRTLPFATRYFVNMYPHQKVEEMVKRLLKLRILRAYPVLVEAGGGLVAQAEHTVCLTETGSVLITAQS